MSEQPTRYERHCPYCGQQLIPDAVFCASCGKRVPAATTVPTPPPVATTPPSPIPPAATTPPSQSPAYPPPMPYTPTTNPYPTMTTRTQAQGIPDWAFILVMTFGLAGGRMLGWLIGWLLIDNAGLIPERYLFTFVSVFMGLFAGLILGLAYKEQKNLGAWITAGMLGGIVSDWVTWLIRWDGGVGFCEIESCFLYAPIIGIIMALVFGIASKKWLLSLFLFISGTLGYIIFSLILYFFDNEIWSWAREPLYQLVIGLGLGLFYGLAIFLEKQLAARKESQPVNPFMMN